MAGSNLLHPGPTGRIQEDAGGSVQIATRAARAELRSSSIRMPPAIHEHAQGAPGTVGDLETARRGRAELSRPRSGRSSSARRLTASGDAEKMPYSHLCRLSEAECVSGGHY
jgi:hypothetical protein